MGIYNPERNLRAHILKHFHSHPKSIEHIIKDYHSNSALNHALVTSLKEKILLNLRNYQVWDRFEDAEIERLIELELHYHIERMKSVHQKQTFYAESFSSHFSIQFAGTSLLIISLLLYTIYQVLVKDFSPSSNSVQYSKGDIETSSGFVLLFMGIVFLLIAGPRVERLYGSVKFIYLFLLPGCIIFPFQNGTIIELLSGCICGIMGIYLGLTLLRKGKASLDKAWIVWGCFFIYLATYYYKLGSLFNPFPLIVAAVIGFLFSKWIKFKVRGVK
ncbi:hypothetical protein [Sutcliffiella horikoshii]|uniref:hypothetical protein n=1 Tax=Sutcliffiella horikoshii TaxID=79883 RepID=UPI001F35692C|nr:hypothetical protein [Sutcliffiella horikoshii]MCG1021488.1 hypothetical protein [Sutcliffiella horikoshii]